MDRILFVLCVSSSVQLSFSALLRSKSEGSQHYEGRYFQHYLNRVEKDSKMCRAPNILNDSAFWAAFLYEVVDKKAWKCSFPSDVLTASITEDSALYKDDTTFHKRRQGITEFINNGTLWSTVITGACKELADERDGEFVRKLKDLHLLEALRDFVDHINYFYQVASIMNIRGQEVIVLSPDSSPIHDIDKLDPIMLVGYSERFEDNQNTSLWQKCVDHHTKKNPHHQAHCIWRDCCRCGSSATNNTKVCLGCDNVRNTALKEMVCDKVSRRLQKDLDGEISDIMWDTDMNFYKGLPAQWIDKAYELMQRLKTSKEESTTVFNLGSAFVHG